MRKLLSLVLLISALPASALENSRVDKDIHCLLGQVAQSRATFFRNGNAYDGKAASDHLLKKYQYARKKIHSVDEFIDLAGTRSWITKREYRIRDESGHQFSSADWLRTLYQKACVEQPSHPKDGLKSP